MSTIQSPTTTTTNKRKRETDPTADPTTTAMTTMISIPCDAIRLEFPADKVPDAAKILNAIPAKIEMSKKPSQYKSLQTVVQEFRLYFNQPEKKSKFVLNLQRSISTNGQVKYSIFGDHDSWSSSKIRELAKSFLGDNAKWVPSKKEWFVMTTPKIGDPFAGLWGYSVKLVAFNVDEALLVHKGDIKQYLTRSD